MERITGLGLSDDEVASILGEGIHAGLRKGSEASDSGAMWQMIRDSQTTAWSDALAYCVWGLGVMGLRVVKVEGALTNANLD